MLATLVTLALQSLGVFAFICAFVSAMLVWPRTRPHLGRYAEFIAARENRLSTTEVTQITQRPLEAPDPIEGDGTPGTRNHSCGGAGRRVITSTARGYSVDDNVREAAHVVVTPRGSHIPLV